MDQRERTAIQRQLAHEALAKLNAIGEWFGVEEHRRSANERDFAIWQEAVKEFESWLFSESPIA